jgi:hypothetical protein
MGLIAVHVASRLESICGVMSMMKRITWAPRGARSQARSDSSNCGLERA